MRWIRIAIACVCLATAAPSQAHPHAWIDLHTALVFDDRGHVTALEQAWLIDPFYSLVLVEDMLQVRRASDLELQLGAIAARMMGNLEAHDYFTELRYAGEPVTGLSHADARLRRERGRLELAFTLTFPQALDPTSGTIEYMVYDGSYYIEVLHEKHAVIALRGGSEGCDVRVHAPRPDPALVARAAALDAGLRPCTGAILVLAVANMLGLWPAGLAAVLAMSVGTAITVSALAVLAVTARHWAGRAAVRAPSLGLQRAGQAAALAGGAVIALVGLSLLAAGASDPVPPLLR